MPKLSSTQPPKTCIETKTLDIALLQQHGMLDPGHRRLTGTWTSRGSAPLLISVESIINPGNDSYLVLSYTMPKGNAHEYQVDLVTVPSNLPGSTASRFYMECPVTGRRASILYLREGTELFAHRQAYPKKRFYYDSQLEQKRCRGLTKNYEAGKAWKKEATAKYRKTIYAGKETKWFTALLQKVQRGRILTNQAMLRLAPY
jgi:hypothetical protein